jgi:hypothetical protein
MKKNLLIIFHHFKKNKKCTQTLKNVNLKYSSFIFYFVLLISTIRYNFSLNLIKIFKILGVLIFLKKKSDMDIFTNSVKF